MSRRTGSGETKGLTVRSDSVSRVHSLVKHGTDYVKGVQGRRQEEFLKIRVRRRLEPYRWSRQRLCMPTSARKVLTYSVTKYQEARGDGRSMGITDETISMACEQRDN